VKILILKPSSLGDVVQAIPVLRLLKQHVPSSEIYWWVQSTLAPLLEGDPDLAGVLRFERNGWSTLQRWRELWRSLRWIREQRFDWVIDLQGLARSGAVAWLANGKLTVGLDEPREGARGFYDFMASRPSFHTHAVDWYLQVLPLLGLSRATHSDPGLRVVGDPNAPRWGSALKPEQDFVWLPSRPEVAAGLRRKWPADAAKWVLLQPGARWSNKRWPTEHFIGLISCLTEKHPELRFAILGAREDQSLGQVIADSHSKRCLDLTGQLSLLELVEWIRLSEVMITNDTGPMHIASALHKPVVALFGPTEPRRTGPYGQLEHVLQLSLPCEPCLRPRCVYYQPLECLRAISPATVADAVLHRLAERLKAPNTKLQAPEKLQKPNTQSELQATNSNPR
jgi:ADP-heptose:LPS heptosyltransferase